MNFFNHNLMQPFCEFLIFVIGLFARAIYNSAFLIRYSIFQKSAPLRLPVNFSIMRQPNSNMKILTSALWCL